MKKPYLGAENLMIMWTHLEGFDELTAEELDALILAPVLITILVAGADGEIDREERFWTERLLQVRTYSRPKILNEFYRVVSNGFLDKVDREMANFPADPKVRNALIAEKLEALNPILAKLDPFLRSDLYKSYTGLAREAAVSSGGFLRFGAINPAEAEWVNLPMITPVMKPIEPDESFKDKKGVDDQDDDWNADVKDYWDE